MTDRWVVFDEDTGSEVYRGTREKCTRYLAEHFEDEVYEPTLHPIRDGKRDPRPYSWVWN